MEISNLKLSDIGRQVKYIPFKNCDPSLIEYGIITSWNDNFIFVRYGKDINSKATKSKDLEFCFK